MVLALVVKRREAIRLRKSGLPYSEIRKELGVSKSSLSYWLRGVELAEPHLKAISVNWIAKRVETYRQTVRKRTAALAQKQLDTAKKSLGKITKRDLLIAGLFLYLGEGDKGSRWNVGISNSDPEVIRFAVRWLTDILAVPRNKIRIRLHLYKDMVIVKEFSFWSKVTGIPLSQFMKPYVKNSLFSSIDYKTHGHGTCNVLVGGGAIKQRITAEIKAIVDSLNMRP